MAELFHRQCVLRRNELQTTAWLPERFAKVGKFVEVYEDAGWRNGWRIAEVGARMASSELLERSRDYQNTRKASDV